jgi:hypothetical protein
VFDLGELAPLEPDSDVAEYQQVVHQGADEGSPLLESNSSTGGIVSGESRLLRAAGPWGGAPALLGALQIGDRLIIHG